MNIYNKTQLTKEMNDRGINLTYLTIYNYERKKVITPIGKQTYRGRKINLYSDDAIIEIAKYYAQVKQGRPIGYRK